MTPRRFFALAGVLALVGCQGVLGIDDLEVEGGSAAGSGGASGATGAGGRGPSASGGRGGATSAGGLGNAGAGGAGGAGLGKAGAGGAGGGKAGAGGSGVGKAGSGGSGGTGGGSSGDAVKACQWQCLEGHSWWTPGQFFDALDGCACEEGERPSCEGVCNSCEIEGYEFGWQTAQCVACLADKFGSDECKGDAKKCKGPCKEFAQCLDACGAP